MVFSTHLFLFYFLPLVLLLNYTLPFRYLSFVLTILSYLFYGWANPVWILLMLFSSYVDYFCGLALAKSSGLPCMGGELPLLPRDQPRNKIQKTALAVSIATNLSILGFFKYADFALSNVNEFARLLGLGTGSIPLLKVALPVGISFYTFESMSYAFDVYSGNARAMRNPINYQFFVADFPHLVAGPIIRYQSIAGQILCRTFTYEKFARGVAFFSLGMAKKILLANPMGHIADCLFAAGRLHWYDAWYGLISYAFQIYFDFSGYSDMAVGLGLMIGLLFMKNFDDPYQSDSITEFWKRWHIALSKWLRDYLFFRLAFAFSKKLDGVKWLGIRDEVWIYGSATMVTMLLGGMWHGAAWNFIIWGGLHGAMLSIERLQTKRGFYRRLPRPVRIGITFVAVCISWVFFRAASLPEAFAFLKSLFGIAHVPLAHAAVSAVVYSPYYLAVFVLCIPLVWGAPQAWVFTQRLSPARALVCLMMLIMSVFVMWTQSVNPFLYFQF